MAMVSLDNYIAASKQRVGWIKTGTARTTVATIPFTLHEISGNPGAGTLAGASTATAILQTDAIAGYPLIDFITGTSYLTKVEFGNSVACRIRLVDTITKSGPYSYAAGTTAISSSPDITTRCPDYAGGSSYGSRNEIWIQISTAFVTGTAWQVQVTYTNQAGVTAKTSIISVAQAAAALTIGKLFQIGLATGDTGVQKVQSVIVTNGGTAMTAGAFDVLVVRNIWQGRVRINNDGDTHDLLKTGAPIIYNDSALSFWVQTDSTSSGVPEIMFELANNG